MEIGQRIEYATAVVLSSSDHYEELHASEHEGGGSVGIVLEDAGEEPADGQPHDDQPVGPRRYEQTRVSANKRAIAEKGRCEQDDVPVQLAQLRCPKIADFLHQLQDRLLQPDKPHLLLLVRLSAGALDRT